MKKMYMVAFLVSVMVCSLFLTGFTLSKTENSTAFAIGESMPDESTALHEQEVRRKPTIEDEFSDEIILVVLNELATRSFKQYTIDDFRDIGVSSVEEITASDAESRILKLILENPNKANVLSAIEQLEKRQDVESAEPSYGGNSILTVNTLLKCIISVLLLLSFALLSITLWGYNSKIERSNKITKGGTQI